MSASDYEIHLDRDRYSALWGDDDSEPEAFAFGEDESALERIIEEELGPPRRRRRGLVRAPK
jgi:hypothetical protein